jgi:hypothetical protein
MNKLILSPDVSQSPSRYTPGRWVLDRCEYLLLYTEAVYPSMEMMLITCQFRSRQWRRLWH